MTTQHVAASTPKGRDIVETVTSFLRRWADTKHPAGRPNTNPAARSAVLDLIEEADDHLIIDIAACLASWEDPS